MQYTIAIFAFVASVSAQSTSVDPTPVAPGYSSAPATCAKSWSGNFEIATHNYTTDGLPLSPTYQYKGLTQLPSCQTNPVITLKDGTLRDQDNRIAEVLSSNHQFQFDDPLQDQRAYASGYEVCKDPSGALLLAHGPGNTTWQSCRSGDFSNLYEGGIAAQCSRITIEVLACPNSFPIYDGSSSGSESTSSSSSISSSVTATTMSSTSVSSTSVSLTDVAISTPVSAPVTNAPATGAAPYPTGNATVPAASGTGSPSSTAPGGSTSSPVTAPASGAQALSVSVQIGTLVVAAVAFSLL